eukprot:s158_g14.t1
MSVYIPAQLSCFAPRGDQVSKRRALTCAQVCGTWLKLLGGDATNAGLLAGHSYRGSNGMKSAITAGLSNADRFLWACPSGSSKTCNSKRWKLPGDPSPESISTLNEWCQAMSPHLMEAAASTSLAGAAASMSRPVVKGDVVYEVSEAAPFTASVSLTPDTLFGSKSHPPGRRFLGQPCSAKKPAEPRRCSNTLPILGEQAAAAKALQALQELLPVRTLQLKSPSAPNHHQAVTANYKGQLVEQLQQLLGRTLKPGDVIFKTQADVPPFVTSVEVNVLQPSALLGTACPTKKLPPNLKKTKAAEQSAAQAMVEKLHRDHQDKLKRKPVPGPMAPAFSCTVTLTLGDSVIVEATSEKGRSFCSKQAAKENAAFRACDLLSQRVSGVAGQLQLAEQLGRYSFGELWQIQALYLVRMRQGGIQEPSGSAAFAASKCPAPCGSGHWRLREGGNAVMRREVFLSLRTRPYLQVAEWFGQCFVVELLWLPETYHYQGTALAELPQSAPLIQNLILYGGVQRPDLSHYQLNDSQLEAVRSALSSPVTLIHGPPGTGKTRTAAVVALTFASHNAQSSARACILYTANSNRAVDVAAEAITELSTERLEDLFETQAQELFGALSCFDFCRDEKCAICWGEGCNAITFCGHVFHRHCLDPNNACADLAVGKPQPPAPDSIMSALRRAFPKLHLSLCRPVSVLVEATPNPKSMKFVLEDGECRTMLFRSPHEAIQSPLAKSLLELDGVREVLLAAEHVTVTKSTLAEWEDLQDVVEGEISKFYEAGHTVIEASAVESTDPQERVRPFVQQDGGDIEFVRFDHADSTLYLKMVGSCSGCSQSHATLQEGVKNLMDHYIPQVKQIVGLNDEMDWAVVRVL